MSDNLYWLWLALSCNAETGNTLLEHFSHPYDIFKADETEIKRCFSPHVPVAVLRLLQKDLEPAKQLMDYCFLNKIGILTLGSSAYPAALRQITNPPLLLYYRGELPNFEKVLSLAVVGTREPTPYGEKIAFQIAHDLAKSGALIVSGLARGIDGIAAAGAISADAPTVAVLGSGLDRIYPSVHQKLASDILKCGGLILSEYPPNAAPERYHFPERNRIISGISAGVVLVEGGEHSGALITANAAKEQGRRVFAVPGNVDSELSFAANYLIRRGATAVTSADDIFDSLPKNSLRNIHISNLLRKDNVVREEVLTSLSVAASTNEPKKKPKNPLRSILSFRPREIENDTDELPLSITESEAKSIPSVALPSLSPEENAVYSAISAHDGSTVDEIAVKTGLPIEKILPTLLMLEVGGTIRSAPGGRYRRT